MKRLFIHGTMTMATIALTLLLQGCAKTPTTNAPKPPTDNNPSTAHLTQSECTRLGLVNQRNSTCPSGNECSNGPGRSLCTTD
jgi:hypothetical protein